MSWTERLPLMQSRRNHSLSTSQYAERDIEENKVLCGYLRKLKHMRKRWFVLYSGTKEHSSHLEYHDNDRKWRAGMPPSREIILEKCLNICRKQDTRDSKNKYVIAIYTDVDCLSMLFEEEQELKTWLIHLLRLQKDPDGSTVDDGKIPRPKFENMWQVIVKNFKAEDPQNRFVMEGHYRLCVTEEDLRFFPIGSTTPLRFEITCLRRCLFRDRMFQLSVGRGAPSGAGIMGIQCDDAEIAANLNRAVLEAIEWRSKNADMFKLPQHVIDAMVRRQKKAEAAEAKAAEAKAAAEAGKASSSSKDTSSSSHHSRSSHERSSSSHRPRAESCSEIDRSTSAGSSTSGSAPKHKASLQTSHHPSSSSHRHEHVATSMIRRLQGRTRTTSEGHHPRLGVGTKSGSLVSSGSPLSPSPGSCVSSESAGSSNSLDDSDFIHHEKRHLNDPQPSTIFEESSAESCIDPVRSSRHGASSPSDGGSAATVTHTRTLSDTVQYTSVEVAPVPAPSPASLLVAASTGAAANVPPAGRQIQTHYAAVANPAPATSVSGTSEYMVMTPISATSSLKRHSSLDQGGAEQRRLQMLGLVTNDESSSSNPMTRSGSIATTAASPSSQSSYNAIEDVEDGSVNASGYSIMSPVGSLPRPPSSTASKRGKVAPAATTPTTAAAAGGGDEYLAMSPVSTLNSKAKASPFVPKSAPTASASAAAAKAKMDIPVRPTTASPQAASDKPKDEYMVMSPVNVDPVDIKHRIVQEAEEEDEELKNIRRNLEVTPGTPVHLRSGSDMSATGARPKHTRNSSKRSSFCSDGGAEGGRWSPPVPWDMQAMDPLGGHLQKQPEPENPEYATMDYTRRPHHPHHPSAHSSAASAIPIPSSAHVAGGRMSPASSGSLGVSHGTPNSCMINSGHGRGAADSDDDDGPIQTFESKARSYLRRDDDDDETPSSAGRSSQASALADSKLPLRAYSISSAARAPSSSSSQGGRSRTSSMSSSKMSAAASRASRLVVPGGGGSGRTPTGQSPIQVFSRIDNWFRSRAGSVPSRQQLSGRRRHRTQSEGEKDSPENQEEAEAAAETKTKTAVSGGSSGGGSAESPNAKG